MPDVDKLSIKIEAESAQAAERVNSLASALERLGKSVKGSGISSVAEKVKSVRMAAKGSPTVAVNSDTRQVDEAIKKIAILRRAKDTLGIKRKINVDSSSVDKANKKVGMLSKALGAIKRIAFYRAIRSGMKIVSETFSTGTNNLYQYSKALRTEFSDKMDMLATSALYLKNSIGAMVSPLINMVAPIVDRLVDRFVDLLNIINQVFAALSGKTSYTKAIKQTQEYADATNGAAKAVRSFQLGIDELNVIEPTIGGAGGADQDFSTMFEEAEISDNILDIAERLKPILSIVGAIGTGFAAWKISSSLIRGVENLGKKLNGIGGVKTFSLSFSAIGLLGFLNDMKKFSDFFDDFKGNGPTFKNVVGMLSEFIGAVGDISITVGNLKLGGFLKIVQGIGEIIGAIKDIADNGLNWDNANLAIQGITDIGIGISAMSGNWKLAGAFLAVQGLTTIITEIGKNWDAIKEGDWSGVDKGVLLIGAIEVIGGVATALGAIEKIKGIFTGGGASSVVSSVASEAGAVNSPLKDLAKNLAWGIVIIAEVSAAAVIILGAIQIMGRQLEDIGNAWQPVIDNGETIANAILIGTGLLIAAGLAAAGIGAVTKGAGGTIALDMAIGAGVLLGIGAAAILFLAEIETVGNKLADIKTAWEPINGSGEEIANDIAIGTGLLVGIGVVTAALGVATVASAGLLPVAIGLGAAILAELAVAFIAFTNSLVDVANEINDNLAPSLRRLNPNLPTLKDDMSAFADSMDSISEEISSYTKSMGGITWSSIVSGFQKLFSGNPLKSMADDVATIEQDANALNTNLSTANPELTETVGLFTNYSNLMGKLQEITSGVENVNLASGTYVNLKDVGKNIITGLSDGMIDKKKLISDRTGEIEKMFGTMADNSNRKISSIITKLGEIPRNITTTYTIITREEGGGGSNLRGYASGGFPNRGEMFIAREAGPELVGTIGNKTAVANTQQIVQGIQQGVSDANQEQNALLREQNELLRAILAKEGNVKIDGKTIKNAYDKASRQSGASIMAGGVMG